MPWPKPENPPPEACASGGGALDWNLQTERLQLRPVGEDEVDVLHALWTAPAVRRHLWEDRILRREQTRDLVMQSAFLFQEQQIGLWLARDRQDEQLVGVGGYWMFRAHHETELLAAVAESHWYRGYGRELSAGVIRYGFERLGFEQIRASADADNQASLALLESLGFIAAAASQADGRLRKFHLPKGVYLGPQQYPA